MHARSLFFILSRSTALAGTDAAPIKHDYQLIGMSPIHGIAESRLTKEN
jgi:hypothetical protein